MASKKRPTIKDVATAAGVSRTLVSFVMNDSAKPSGKPCHRVKESTREHILEVARRLNYQPNPTARNLRNGRTHVIGVAVADISNIFYGGIARNIENLAYAHGYTVLFASTDENLSRLDSIVRTFIGRGVEGILIVPCEGAQRCLQPIVDQKIPMVIFDRRDLPFDVPKVVLNNRRAMNHAVELLLGKGIRRIEMISYTMRVSSITEREEGYVARMYEAGMSDDDLWIHRVPFDSIGTDIARILPGILERRAEGLVFATNSLTVSTITALVAAGVRVQKDIQIVGFDNSDVYGLFSPPIAHIRQPIPEICRRSVEYLFALIEKEQLPGPLDIEIEPEVINM